MNKMHHYAVAITWTGNKGMGTKDYRSYERSHTISIDNKIDIAGSSDAAFRGDKTKHSPEDLFVASIAACHMLWYLHLCSDAGIIVTSYMDHTTATMIETDDGGGRFSEVTLHPEIIITDAAMITKAGELHHKANELCFVANSCNFPIHHKPVVFSAGSS